MNYRGLLAVVGGMLAGSVLHAQPLLNARATALGAYDALVNDSRSFVANPAGMVSMRDWDFNSSTYVTTARGSGNGFVFDGFSVGKRFFETNAAAVEYTPGALLEFVLPSALKISGLADAQKKISYSEPVAIGLAHRFGDNLSVGVQARLRTESVTDPQFQIQLTDSVISATANQSTRDIWFTDLGVSWKPVPALTLSAVGRNLVQFKHGVFPEEFQPFYLPTRREAEMGVAYSFAPGGAVCAEARTEHIATLGGEWVPAYDIALRGGLSMGPEEQPFVYALSLGSGWSYEFLQVDGAFLHFLGGANRTGTVGAGAFDASTIDDISMSPFTRDRVCLSVKAMFGNVRESLARIESLEITGSIFPSQEEALAFRPIGAVRVRNTSQRPQQVKASIVLENLMDAPSESPRVYIMPGEAVEIPLTAVLNDNVKNIRQATIRDAEVRVSTSEGSSDDRAQAKVLIRGRNDWDGQANSLRYFVMPNDVAIVRYSRDVLLQQMDSLVSAPRQLQVFRKAKTLFDAFAGKLLYVNDPKSTGDYVQYPSETLSLRGGDCTDMTVCFASLLGSVGISTAFVDVVPPAHPEQSHIYLLFDTGLDPRYGASVAENPKRYVVRRTKSGNETVWIPVETTVIARGFEEAWTKGAQEYLDNVEVGLGIVKGWVRIVDVY